MSSSNEPIRHFNKRNVSLVGSYLGSGKQNVFQIAVTGSPTSPLRLVFFLVIQKTSHILTENEYAKLAKMLLSLTRIL